MFYPKVIKIEGSMAATHLRDNVYQRINTMTGSKRRKWLVREQRVPRFIFKYFPLQATAEETKSRFRQVLVESKLWMSAVEDFNDPFDAQMAVSGGGSPAQQKAHLLEIARTTEPPPGRQPLSEAELGAAIDRMIAEGNVGVAAQRGYDNALSRMGVCCFASDARSILMWSHYATSHRGICAVFQPDIAPDPLIEALPVKYTRTYPTFDKILDDPTQLAVRGLLGKFKRWQYEGERRIIRLDAARSFLSFGSEALVGVVLGCGASPETQDAVAELLAERREAKLPNVLTLRARRQPDRYALSIYSE